MSPSKTRCAITTTTRAFGGRQGRWFRSGKTAEKLSSWNVADGALSRYLRSDGRDGAALVAAGLGYSGVDLSPKAAEMCRGLALDAREAQATFLPFGDGTFDAAWSMSTLVHLPAGGKATALAELRRMLRPSGLMEIGVWGDTVTREVTGFSGRYFYLRTDAALQALLTEVGTIEDSMTWDWRDDCFDGGGHYQWACVSLPR